VKKEGNFHRVKRLRSLQSLIQTEHMITNEFVVERFSIQSFSEVTKRQYYNEQSQFFFIVSSKIEIENEESKELEKTVYKNRILLKIELSLIKM